MYARATPAESSASETMAEREDRRGLPGVKKQGLPSPPYGDGGVTHPYAAKSILSLSITDTPRLGHIEL
jgi:hypothetical protein